MLKAMFINKFVVFLRHENVDSATRQTARIEVDFRPSSKLDELELSGRNSK